MTSHIRIRAPKDTPSPPSSFLSRNRYPWKQTLEGGSFVVPAHDRNLKKLAASVQSAGYSWLKKHKPHLTVVVKIDEENDEVHALVVRRTGVSAFSLETE